MTTVMQSGGSLAEVARGSGAHARGWVTEMRRVGAARFGEVGLPTTTMEAWRNTNVGALERGKFVVAGAGEKGAARELFGRFSFGREACIEIVFVNGHFCPELSSLKQGPVGVTVMCLEKATDPLIEKHLGKHADIKRNPFVALNNALLGEGAYVRVGRGIAVGKPIHVLFLSLPEGGDGVVAMSSPRLLVVAEENCDAAVVETYAGDGAYFANAVTEIVLEKAARLDHCKVNEESTAAFHVATMQVNQAERSSFVSHSATLGGKLTRNDLNCYLGGEHAEATLNGVVVLSGEQHCDNHTLLQHEKANCPSHELYKHVLADKASAVFKGQIYVQQDAQKTDAKQTSKTLLLSNTAVMNSQPALEIYADDVKCTHGSTIGPVDEGAVFYLQSRGLNYETARALLTYAFAADITRRIRVAPVRARIEDFMSARQGLPQDLRITEGAEAQVPLL